MKTKVIVAVVPLILAGLFFSLFAYNHSKHSSAKTPPATEVANDARVRARVVAYYFHGNARCATCKKIESMSHDVLVSGFQDQLKSGQLAWQPVNVEAPENEHFFTDYKLITWSLVLVNYEGAKQKNFKVLSDTWKLVGDETKFRQYVGGEVQSAIGRI